MRASPLVRITKSGSGSECVSKYRAKTSAVTSFAASAALHIPRHTLRRARHLITAPIVERDGQMHFGVLRRQCLKLIHQFDQRFIEPQAIPDEANPHALIHQILASRNM